MGGFVSPFAPDTYPPLPEVAGMRLATAEAGIKYRGRTDLLGVVFDQPATVAGVFTQSKCASAPVEWCRDRLGRGAARALLVNSGNANAFTGMRGQEATRRSARAFAEAVGCAADDVYLASTGVIGEPLDPSKFERAVGGLVAQARPGQLLDAARAIMTTDTFPKARSVTARIGGETVTVAGIAKGAGMIAPDMATMLAFLFTDAAISAPALQRALSAAVGDTFNAVTVDGDTSTSDTVLLFATGAAADRGVATIADPGDRRLAGFRKALKSLMADLARDIVKDGEGLSKVFSVTVEGAMSKRSARTIARSIANSPLVKTAMAGSDANWGRVVMAVGKAGEPADRDRLAIWFGDLRVAYAGERDPDYSEDAAAAYMRASEIAIRVDLGLGRGRDTVWSCDLTADYVAINADYRS